MSKPHIIEVDACMVNRPAMSQHISWPIHAKTPNKSLSYYAHAQKYIFSHQSDFLKVVQWAFFAFFIFIIKIGKITRNTVKYCEIT